MTTTASEPKEEISIPKKAWNRITELLIAAAGGPVRITVKNEETDEVIDLEIFDVSNEPPPE